MQVATKKVKGNTKRKEKKKKKKEKKKKEEKRRKEKPRLPSCKSVSKLFPDSKELCKENKYS